MKIFIENAESFLGMQCIFVPDAQLVQLEPECADYSGLQCTIEGIDVTPTATSGKFEDGYYTVRFKKDGCVMSAISGHSLRR